MATLVTLEEYDRRTGELMGRIAILERENEELRRNASSHYSSIHRQVAEGMNELCLQCTGEPTCPLKNITMVSS